MDVEVTIRYTTDDEDANLSIGEILNHTLPYMVDNVTIHFDVRED